MEKLPPIPTPLATRWREFRYQFLPFITFAVIVAVVAVMWRTYVVPPNVLAEVEPMTANVISTQPGTVVTLNVERFQRVTNGQEIGQVLVLETNVLMAGLLEIEADLQVRRSQLDLTTLRDSMIYERERLLYLQEVVQHNINKVLLIRYTAEYLRASNLFNSKNPVMSQQDYEKAQAQYEKYKVDVEETTKFLAEKEKALPRLKVDASNTLHFVELEIKAQEERLKAVNQNLILRAPIDGTVSTIKHRPGERVVAGDPIVVITPLNSDRIIAYVRQPMNVVPKVNDWVQIRRQTFKREVGYGKVVEVGTQLEAIDKALLASQGTAVKVEMALPFLVRVRDAMNLAPGERVDLILNPRMKPIAN
jgi:multidrug resistance efflux pump